MQGVFDKYPDQIELATSAQDIERIVGQKKIAAVLTGRADTRSMTISGYFVCIDASAFVHDSDPFSQQ